MKTKLLNAIIALILLIPNINFAQAPNLGTTAEFVLFSTDGAITNTGHSQITGNIGTSNGITGFGNVNGVLHNKDGVSAKCADDLLLVYNNLNNTIPTFSHSPLIGNGDTLVAGVYSISAAATLDSLLILDAKGNADAQFIFQIQGSFSTSTKSKVKLINGAIACNVFWKVEGLVSLASGTSMKGIIVANNAAINLNSGVILEGRAFTTAGAITLNTVLAYTPIGCGGSLILTGPTAVNLNSSACYALFSGSGAVSNSGISNITGNIGTNVGLTTGFDALKVEGKIHPISDVSTATVAASLSTIYIYLNTLPYDIELLYPEQLGSNLVLTPHTYIMKAAAILTDTLYLNAQGNVNAVFVFQINGAFSTSTFAKVALLNGTQAKNVFWKIDGATEINDSTIFCGTIVANNGAVSLKTGVLLNGRAFTTTGTLTTDAITAYIPSVCTSTGIGSIDENASIIVYPNPFSSTLTVELDNALQNTSYEIQIYDMLGNSVLVSAITKQTNTINTNSLVSGIYFYRVIGNFQTIQTGKLLSN